MSDQARANRLLNQGRAFVSQNNLDGLRNAVKELWNLLPTEAVTEIQRGYTSAVAAADHVRRGVLRASSRMIIGGYVRRERRNDGPVLRCYRSR
jgi:hypothetical protein